MLISTALLLDCNIRNSVCTPAKLPCRRVEVGYIAKARKEAAITRKSRYRTGGGSATRDQVNLLVPSFINSKTVGGLENDFDNDALLF
ncbi:unnamed protein product [Tenebrio molitor]|nr:unnamed protein product [Tenebrio molitor]